MTDISSLRIGDSRFVGWSENGNRPAPVDTPGEVALRGPFATANCQVGQCGGGSGGWRGRVERLALRDAHPSLRVHVSAGMSAELANRVAAGELAAAPAVFR